MEICSEGEIAQSYRIGYSRTSQTISAFNFLGFTRVGDESLICLKDIIERIRNNDDDNWVLEIQQGLNKEPSSSILRKMFSVIQRCIRSNDVRRIGEWLNLMKLELMHPTAIVAIARYSSTVRDDELVGSVWQQFVARSRVELLRRRLDADRILKGML